VQNIVVVGGCGRVGLPLGIVFATAGLDVTLLDVAAEKVALVEQGHLPFAEDGAFDELTAARAAGRLHATTHAAVVAEADVVLVVVGTPIDEHLNPDPGAILGAIDEVAPHLQHGQLLVLRSTVHPGVTRLVADRVAPLGVEVAFCPERIAEGRAMTELRSLPQLVSGTTPSALERASALFGHLTDDVVVLEPEEAELAKLFTNTWRYVRFAAANQLYMVANDFGVDYEKVRQAIVHDYPRAADLPGAGFAAGPCLLKDTMQLASFHRSSFGLGHAAMLVNEGLPLYLVDRMAESFDLSHATVGLLGMAFKAGSDDVRDSLSYKLRRLLRFRGAEVLCTDPHVTVDPDLVALDDVLRRADVLVVGAPHDEYRGLDVGERPVVDVWNLLGRGVQV
jgi:UDP-N-acetyl-D-mannosaminuronic acid dehydrogenase